MVKLKNFPISPIFTYQFQTKCHKKVFLVASQHVIISLTILIENKRWLYLKNVHTYLGIIFCTMNIHTHKLLTLCQFVGTYLAKINITLFLNVVYLYIQKNNNVNSNKGDQQHYNWLPIGIIEQLHKFSY